MILIFLMLMSVFANVGVCAFEQSEEPKEAILVHVCAPGAQQSCSGVWDVSGMLTAQGISFKQAIKDAWLILYREGPGRSVFLDHCMNVLRGCNCEGEQFTDMGRGSTPLSEGIFLVEGGLTWVVKFSNRDHCPRNKEKFPEFVRLSVLGEGVSISGFSGRYYLEAKNELY